MSLPSLTLNQGENGMSGANNYLKEYSSNPSMALGSRAFGKELTNYGRSEPEYLKDYNLRSKNYKTNNTGIGTKLSMAVDQSNKMKIESMDGQAQQRDLLSKDENGKNYLKTLLAGDSQIEEIDDVDLTVMDNPQYVCDYVNEVMAFLQETEDKYAPKAGLMVKIQTDINEKMRAILVDWLIDVHLKFKLLPETFYLTINIIDRYLSVAPIARVKLQLVGVAAMLIASKYEEIYPPEVKDFEYVTDRAYNREEILDMEGKILSCLGFNLTTPSSYRFLERYARVAGFDEKHFNLAQYLLELATVEYQMLKYSASNLACSAIYLVNKIQQKKESWTDQMIRHTKYKENQLRPCAKDLCILLQKAAKSNLQAARRKFSSTKFLEVAKITLDKL